MKKLNLWGAASLLSVLIIGFASCNCNTKKDKTTETVQIAKEEVETKVREFVYPLPTSYEIVEMLNEIEASYIFDLANNPANADKYATEKSMALNLGIFGADLSYASTYNQKQETINFIDASKKMLEGLNLQSAVREDLLPQIEANEDNKDALIQLITNSFYDTYDFLNRNNRASVSALVMAGAWVEGIYIATHISEETFNSKEMVTIILKQKEPLLKLMEIMDQYKSNPNVAETIEDFSTMANIYAGIENTAITEEQMTKIAEESLKIRKKIVAIK